MRPALFPREKLMVSRSEHLVENHLEDCRTPGSCWARAGVQRGKIVKILVLVCEFDGSCHLLAGH